MDRVAWKKWTPAVAVPAMIAALVAGGSIAADARTDLPDRTPQELLEMVASHEVEAFSGHLQAGVELGLPRLPGAGDRFHGGAPGAPAETGSPDPDGDSGDAAVDGRITELLSLLSGTHEARVFVDGHDRFRFQLMDGADERNLVRNDGEAWSYDSAENLAVHTTLPQDWQRDGASGDRRDDGSLPTPERMADRLLEKAEEHAVVTVEEGSSDSGRHAYILRLDPRTDQTLVDAITVDVDAETGVPLGVEILSVDQAEPAVRVAFTEFTPEAPDAGLFDFQPPAGATVEERSLDHGGGDDWHGTGDWHGKAEELKRHGTSGHPAGHRGEVVGEGWDAVAILPAEGMPRDLVGSELLQELAVDVEDGRMLSTPLLNVLLTDDGRVLAGSVPQQRLLDVAAADAAGDE